MSYKMCPLSAISQLLVLILWVCLIGFPIIKAQILSVNTKNAEETIMYETVKHINYTVNGTVPGNYNEDLYLQIATEDETVSKPDNQLILLKNQANDGWLSTGSFGSKGVFLGKTYLTLTVKDEKGNRFSETSVNIKVVRPERLIDTIFVATVAALISIIYINFGCALNWGEVCTTIKKPIGPAIGVVGQFIFMPLLSFGLGKLLFPDNPELQLGMFFTGVSPGGGASNVWVAVLNGNINLSITMTTISTFGAFAMMPLWLFTLGGIIFEDANIEVPYRKISTYAISLVVPLAIGYLLQRYCKKIARFFVRILKVFSSLLIIFIIVFATVTNLYLFEIFSWQIFVAGMGLPWLGYVLAYALAKVFRQPSNIALTIAVETGIQNTGIAIFLLRFALPQPEADIVTVIPVYIATMTPIPLLALFIYQRIRARITANAEKKSLVKSGAQCDESSSKVDYSSNATTTTE